MNTGCRTRTQSQDCDCPALVAIYFSLWLTSPCHRSPRSAFQSSLKMIFLYPTLGVAVEDDIFFEARQQIERELAQREAETTVSRILNEILDGVRTPERPRSPVDAYITVRRFFAKKIIR